MRALTWVWERSRDPLNEQRHNSPVHAWQKLSLPLHTRSLRSFRDRRCRSVVRFPCGRLHGGRCRNRCNATDVALRSKQTDDFIKLLRTQGCFRLECVALCRPNRGGALSCSNECREASTPRGPAEKNSQARDKITLVVTTLSLRRPSLLRSMSGFASGSAPAGRRAGLIHPYPRKRHEKSLPPTTSC
jgi:hypothetical protein